ncbi:hypothetical protein DPMN_044092 [Dreissena polymorpha]|uniref:Reverse transcriptase domain-containing protein n=1 Tax=Dreissena polymorpha TaxID=45954 RepID=A0A9D4HYE9_DREPO|nr:hypothetical protein DPMN_044092 [Dreissena polymorpha]
METPTVIRRSIKPMHWGVSLDLEDAFFHVPIHPNYRKYLRFYFRGQVYQLRASPLDWPQLHEFSPNSWPQWAHTSEYTGFNCFSISTIGFYTSSIVDCFCYT